MFNIELIGSNNTKQHYQPNDVADLLMVNKTDFSTDNEFTGRPDTRIHADGNNIVKIRAELNLTQEKAHSWVSKILFQEQKIAIHHPHKTWFIQQQPDTNTVLVGSICPRLRPLNVELNLPPKTQKERMRYLVLLETMFQQYFKLAKTTGFKLDEGLSNFAIDEHGAVFYVDDEYYSWDNFIAFSVMLGVFLRTYTWLDLSFTQLLAQKIISIVDGIYQDPHCRVIISSQLQSLFMPSNDKQQLLDELVKVLSKNPLSSPLPPLLPKKKNYKKSNDRYFAVMADIHSNEAALDCVLDFYKEKNIKQGIVLGDIVGYGPDPVICIKKLQESPFAIIKGNHDHAVAIGNITKGFSKNAQSVIDWTINQLDKSHLEWLKYLPSFSKNKEWLAVHGAPIDPAFFYGYVYLMTAEDNLNYMQDKQLSLCFHGHSHMPGIYARDKHKRDHHLTDKNIVLDNYRQTLICPGSVGQPRNGSPGAQCAIYDRKENRFTFFSIPYSVDPVVQRMKDNGLPEQLWQRLQTGK